MDTEVTVEGEGPEVSPNLLRQCDRLSDKFMHPFPSLLIHSPLQIGIGEVGVGVVTVVDIRDAAAGALTSTTSVMELPRLSSKSLAQFYVYTKPSRHVVDGRAEVAVVSIARRGRGRVCVVLVACYR